MRRVSLAARRARAYLRRPPRPRWLRPVICGGGLLGLVAGLALGWWAAGGANAWQGVSDQLLALSAGAGLAVREVYVEGRVRTPGPTLRAQLAIEIGMPILAVDPAAARDRLEALTWVERASVARLFPGRLHIRLIERQPLALWQRDGRFTLIDRAGAVIEGGLRDARSAAPYEYLRVLVGEDAPAHAAQLFALLSTEPALSARVVAATRVDERRWNLRLDNRAEVLLPEQAPLDAWRFLAAKARDDLLLERAVTVIDLRFLPERLRLRLEPAVLDEWRA